MIELSSVVVVELHIRFMSSQESWSTILRALMLISLTVAPGMLRSSPVPGLLAIAVSEAVPHSGLVVSKSYMSTSMMSEIAAESTDFL